MALTLDVGTAYTYTEQQLWEALGSPGTWSAYDWSVNVAGSVLPPGMTATSTGLTGTPATAGTYTVRLDEATVDEYGDPGPKVAHDLAVTVAAAPAPEPDPEEPTPEPVEPIVTAVAKFMGHPDNPQILALAAEHVRVVTTFVRAYVRRNGFDEQGRPNQDLSDVIIAVTARHLVNPSQHQRESLGAQTVTYARLEGFTLTEQAVLHIYRRRAA